MNYFVSLQREVTINKKNDMETKLLALSIVLCSGDGSAIAKTTVKGQAGSELVLPPYSFNVIKR